MVKPSLSGHFMVAPSGVGLTFPTCKIFVVGKPTERAARPNSSTNPKIFSQSTAKRIMRSS